MHLLLRSARTTPICRRHGVDSNRTVLLYQARKTASSSSLHSQSSRATSFFIGSCAGTLGSLAGMGGGFVMIPLLANVQKLTQHQAHATSLCAVMATGVAGAVSYKEHVLLETAVAIATTGMLSARFGANLTRGVSERALRQALGALMLAVAPMVPLKAQFIKANETTKVSVSPATTAGAFNQQQQLTTILPAAACIGLASGFLAGTFGVGGGVVVVPALCWVCDATHHQALGTSLAAMILPAAVGTYTHYKAGAVVLRVAPALACGALVGAYVGGRVAVMADEAALQWGFSGLLAVLGARTLLRA